MLDGVRAGCQNICSFFQSNQSVRLRLTKGRISVLVSDQRPSHATSSDLWMLCLSDLPPATLETFNLLSFPVLSCSFLLHFCLPVLQFLLSPLFFFFFQFIFLLPSPECELPPQLNPQPSTYVFLGLLLKIHVVPNLSLYTVASIFIQPSLANSGL